MDYRCGDCAGWRSTADTDFDHRPAYSIGAHGIMTLNDFKSVEGDLQMGIRSLPAQLGRERAAKVACVFMLLPQLVVIALLLQWQLAPYAAAVTAVVVAQCSP
ncbi:MAG: hypothetical protein CM15mP103_03500 [Gammaproteobacteria bacterium]|nr:MAG: hypothetical protein CM15mP103_03500 [Gammaproteobacteria bacterium]